jgi:hypothetical protein
MYGLDLSRTGLTITPLAGLMYPGYAAPVYSVCGGGGGLKEKKGHSGLQVAEATVSVRILHFPNCGSGSSHLELGFFITLKVEFYNLPSLFSNLYYFYKKICNIIFNR